MANQTHHHRDPLRPSSISANASPSTHVSLGVPARPARSASSDIRAPAKPPQTRMLLGAHRPPRRHDVPARAPRSRSTRGEVLSRIGAIVEEPHFHSHLTARQNLVGRRRRARAGRLRPHRRRARARRARRPARTRRLDATRRGCASGSASPAACSPTRARRSSTSRRTGSTRPGSSSSATMIRALVAEGRTAFLSSHLLDEVEKPATRRRSSTAERSSPPAPSVRSPRADGG